MASCASDLAAAYSEALVSRVTLRSVPCAVHCCALGAAIKATRSATSAQVFNSILSHRRRVSCAGGTTAWRKAKLRRLLQPRCSMRDRADRTGEADLAEKHAMRRQALPGERGDERRRGGEIGGGFGDAQAARDIEIDVVLAEPQPGAGFEHGDDHGEPVLDPSRRRRGAACRSELGATSA